MKFDSTIKSIRIIIIICFNILGISYSNAIQYTQSITENPIVLETLSYGLPVVVVQTIDEEEPTAEPITHPEGSMGYTIKNATKVPGSVTVLSQEGDTVYSSGEYVKKESGMTIKIRGNTSSYGEKKPYKIKLQEKGDMLGRGNSKYNDKNWVLIFNYDFKSYIGKYIGFLTEQTWMPDGRFVNLVFNGDYRGVYILQESIERNKDCRINVEEDGFIIEHDPYWWNENDQYLASIDHPLFNYTFKYPEFEDIAPETLTTISNVIKKYEDSLQDGTYPETMDVRSFAKWILAHDMLGTSDGAGVNLYLTKESLSNKSLIQCGPLWDFDSSEKTINDFSAVHYFRFNKLFQNNNKTFLKEYVNYWNDNKQRIEICIDSVINDLKKDHWVNYDLSIERDSLRWGSSTLITSAYKAAERLDEWYSERFSWLDNAIRELGEKITIDETRVESIHNILSKKYTISNRILSTKDNLKGIIITGIDGVILFSGDLHPESSVALPSGICIIRCGEDVHKELIK